MTEPGRRLSRARAVFMVAAVMISASFFVGLYPPMTDIPQHAAQVSALGDLLRGESPWEEELEVNLLTPYWIGYGPWLLFSQLLPIHQALGLVLTLGFLAFALLFSKLRETLGAAPIVDWVAIPSFFGFAYEWGMLTFLLAVPVGLGFLITVERWRASGRSRDAAVVVLAGVALYLSHVLAFVYFFACSALVLALDARRSPGRWRGLAWPHAVFVGLLLVYVLRDDPLEGTFVYGPGLFEYGDSVLTRVERLFHYPWSSSWSEAHLPFASAFVLAAPWLMGLRPSKDHARYAPLFTSLVFWFSLPHYMLNTYLVYERFAILLFPAYALIFDAPTLALTGARARIKALGTAVFLSMIAILAARPVADRAFFTSETEMFRRIVDELPAKQRALSLVFARSSDVTRNPNVYLHFPQWYAAEKRGFVDFSFAWFHPQPVRFRRDRLPEIAPSFEWVPRHFTGLERCDRYDALIVRAPAPLPEELLASSTCSHRLTSRQGPWFLYRLPERRRDE